MEGGVENEFGFRRFSTDDFPERDRVTQWREICGRSMMKVDMAPPPDQPFRATAELRLLPNLGIAAITTTPNRLMRSRSLIADGNDDFILVMATRGEAAVSQRNQEVLLSPNSAWLIPSGEPSSTVVQSLSRFVSLAIPAAVLLPMIASIDAALTPLSPGNADAIRLLVSYLGYLREDIALSTPEMRQLVVTHIHDLIALAIGATRDTKEMALGRGVRAARLQAIKAEIVANIGDSRLSIDLVAERQGITPRYVRKLFESEGTSFSEFVLAHRLLRAHRRLSDPRSVALTISAIAFECGFSDLSYFNRTFRRRFSTTPSDVRETARRRD